MLAPIAADGESHGSFRHAVICACGHRKVALGKHHRSSASTIANPHHTVSAFLITMLGLRNIARSAPRSAARLSSKAIRPQSSLLRPVAALPAWTQAAPRLAASFHISAVRRQESDGTKQPSFIGKLAD
jgi:hypothetical protein